MPRIMTRVFVTGGAGFIGSAFIRLLTSQNPASRVANFDSLTYAGILDNLEGLNAGGYDFIRGDITYREVVLDSVGQDTDVMVYFAAESQVVRGIVEIDI